MTRILPLAALITTALVLGSCDDVQFTSADIVVRGKLKAIARAPGRSPVVLKGARAAISGSVLPSIGVVGPKTGSFDVRGFGGANFVLDYNDGDSGDNRVTVSSQGDESFASAVSAMFREISRDFGASFNVDQATLRGTVVCRGSDQEAMFVKATIRFSGTYDIPDGEGFITAPMSGTIQLKGVGDATGTALGSGQ